MERKAKFLLYLRCVTWEVGESCRRVTSSLGRKRDSCEEAFGGALVISEKKKDKMEKTKAN